MADINDLRNAGFESLGLTRTDGQAKDNKALGQGEFLDLMVAQLTNQDPLKPLESQDFLAQVAQFSTVTGIQEVQRSISQLVGSLQSNHALQASTLVGRDVLVPGSRVQLATGTPVKGAADLGAATGALTVTVHSPNGAVVRRMDLGAQPAGVVNFQWDGLDDGGGPAPPGHYVVSAQAAGEAGAQGVATLVSGHVDSVTLNRNPPGMTLNVAGIGPVDVNDIRQLF